MGKMKKQKKRPAAKSPTGLPTLEEVLASVGTAEKPLNIPVFTALNSAEAQDREYGCAGLANLVLEESAWPVLLKHNVVRKLGERLLDVSNGVRAEAAGALRNLTISGGEAVCKAMVKEDIMTPLLSAFTQACKQAQAMENVQDAANLDVLRLVEQACHLLLNLCEASGKALDLANSAEVYECLVHCLQPGRFPPQMVLAAAQCLHTMTEDNEY
eukprot:Colp12_sorted_trinity150504_noHs@10